MVPQRNQRDRVRGILSGLTLGFIVQSAPRLRRLSWMHRLVRLLAGLLLCRRCGLLPYAGSVSQGSALGTEGFMGKRYCLARKSGCDTQAGKCEPKDS